MRALLSDVKAKAGKKVIPITRDIFLLIKAATTILISQKTGAARAALSWVGMQQSVIDVSALLGTWPQPFRIQIELTHGPFG